MGLVLLTRETEDLSAKYTVQGASTQSRSIDCSNNMESNILTCAKNLIQELHKHLSLSTSTTEVLSHRLLPLPMEITDHEK